MKAVCTTNIDCANGLKWPEWFHERPVVGDYVRSASSSKYKYIELQVVRCTWITTKDAPSVLPYLEIELHLPSGRFEKLSDFEKHVKAALSGQPDDNQKWLQELTDKRVI